MKTLWMTTLQEAPPMTLAPNLKDRILAAAAAEPAPVRREVVAETLLTAAAAVVIPLIAFFAIGGAQVGERPLGLIFATGFGAFALAALVLVVALGRGPRMLGRARGLLIAVAVAAPIAFLLWKAGLSSELGADDPIAARPGYRCLALTLTFALAPMLALFFIRRHSDPSHPRSLGLVLGIGAGTSAAALVDLWCPVGHLRHLMIGHILPVVALGLLGIWLGERLLSVRGK